MGGASVLLPCTPMQKVGSAMYVITRCLLMCNQNFRPSGDEYQYSLTLVSIMTFQLNDLYPQTLTMWTYAGDWMPRSIFTTFNNSVAWTDMTYLWSIQNHLWTTPLNDMLSLLYVRIYLL
ncbi:unnamed protein product [Somion occarium]|uniref:Uncharacterized protein n=1 Tax=Somion occarium TaxID=3059160 RepID=A0ABP1E6I2_9APHY